MNGHYKQTDGDLACLERLESRLLLAGDVTAVVVNGDLRITGDAADNEVVLIRNGMGPDEFLLDSDPRSGTTINGQAGPAILSGVTGDVLFDMGDGDDYVTLDGVELLGSLKVDAGSGWDWLHMFDSLLHGDVQVVGTGGSWNGDYWEWDSVDVDVENTTIEGNLTVNAPDGYLWLSGSSVGGNLSARYNGGDWYGWSIEGVPIYRVQIESSTIGGNLSVKSLRAWGDSLLLDQSTVGGDATVVYRRGDGDVEVYDSTIGGDLTVRLQGGYNPWYEEYSEHYVYLGGLDVAGNLTIQTGAADLSVWLDQMNVAQNILITSRRGDSYIEAEGLTVGGDLTVRSQGGYFPWYEEYSDFDVELSGLDVAGNLTLQTGAADLSVGLKRVNVGQDVLVTNWRSYGAVTVYDSAIGGDLTIRLQGGDDARNEEGGYHDVEMSELDVAGNLTIRAGAADLSVKLEDANIGQDVLVTSRRGDDIGFYIEEVVVGGSLTLRSGANDYTEIYLWAISIGENLTVQTRNADDYVDLYELTVGGKLTVITRSGDDEIEVNDSSFAGLSRLSTGRGDDVILLDTYAEFVEGVEGGAETPVGGALTDFGSTLRIRTGAGDDSIVVGQAGEQGNLAIFNDRAAFRGGSGSDSLTLLAAEGTVGAPAIDLLALMSVEDVELDTSGEWWQPADPIVTDWLPISSIIVDSTMDDFDSGLLLTGWHESSGFVSS